MSEDITLTIERDAREKGIVVLGLAGELLITNREELRRRAEAEIADGARSLVVALDGLSHIDTSGLAMLVHLAYRCGEAGGHLAVAGLREDFREIRRHLHLDEALLFSENVEDAVAVVSR